MSPVKSLLGKMIICAVVLLVSSSGMRSAWAVPNKAAASADARACSVALLENKDLFPALIRAIDEAHQEILICMFSFKAGVHPNSYPDRIVEHLARAVQRGVQVEVVLETTGDRANDLTAQNLKTKVLLEEKGVNVYLDDPHKTTHAKLVVVDERRVFMGSHNLTASALKHNNEISVLIDQPDLAKKIRRYIFTIIKEAK